MNKEYTVKEIAELLEVSKPTVQRAINKLSIEASNTVKNKYRLYCFEDVRAIIEAIRPDFDFAVFETPNQCFETLRNSGETPQQVSETPQQNTETLNQNTATPKQENSGSDTEALSIMLEMLKKEIEKKDKELEKKDQKIEALENKLHDAYGQIADFGKKAQYITAVDKTNQYLANKSGEENIAENGNLDKVIEEEPKKKSFFAKLFGK